MLRTVQRAVRTGGVGGGPTQEPFSHSTTSQPTNTSPRSSTTYKPTTSNTLFLSSPTSLFSKNPFNVAPMSAASNWASSCSSLTDEFDQWECVDGTISDDHDEETTSLPVVFNCDDHFVFGPVPSLDEVQHAVTSLHQVLDLVSFSQLIKDRAAYDSDKDVPDHTTRPVGFVGRVPSVGSEVDWVEPSLNLCNSRLSQPCGSNKVYDAFHLLQTEPSVQRMVISLSSDKAVWDAVLNNEVVQELRKSLDDADKNADVSSVSDEASDDSKAAMDVLSWIFINTKAKIMDLIDKITKMVDELFLPPKSEKKIGKAEDSFEGKLRTSFLLSIVVFLVVVVTRASKA